MHCREEGSDVNEAEGREVANNLFTASFYLQSTANWFMVQGRMEEAEELDRLHDIVEAKAQELHTPSRRRPVWPHPFWNTPLARADAQFSPGLPEGEIPDPDAMVAAGWRISADGNQSWRPDDDTPTPEGVELYPPAWPGRNPPERQHDTFPVLAPEGEEVPETMMTGSTSGFGTNRSGGMSLGSLSAYWRDGSVSLASQDQGDQADVVIDVIGRMERRPWSPSAPEQPRHRFVRLRKPEGSTLEVMAHPETGVTVLKLRVTGWHGFRSWRIVPGSVPTVSVEPHIVLLGLPPTST